MAMVATVITGNERSSPRISSSVATQAASAAARLSTVPKRCASST